jgi:hypothetical protein
MTTFDFEQRVEEIQLALAGIFESPKRPTVSLVDEGDTVILQLSWVVQSQRDTTLDSRCAATVRFSREQLDHYAALDTKRRRMIQQRISDRVHERFAASQTPPAIHGDCAVEIDLDDAVFETPEGFL